MKGIKKRKFRAQCLPYQADVRNAMLGIRRGIPYDNKGRATGEHPSEVYVKQQRG